MSMEFCPVEGLRSVRGISYIDQTKPKPTGAVFLLHGSCGTGRDFHETIQQILGANATFPHIRIIFPTAPDTSYTPLGGAKVPTWYDISGFSHDAYENNSEIDVVAKDLMQLMQREVQCGIPKNRIAFAGFSRGGGMSLHMGYRFTKDIAGIGVMSSFLPESSLVYEELKYQKPDVNLPVLLQLHGKEDSLVNVEEANRTFEKLKSLGAKGTYETYEDLGHEISKEELEKLYDFIYNIIPDNV